MFVCLRNIHVDLFMGVYSFKTLMNINGFTFKHQQYIFFKFIISFHFLLFAHTWSILLPLDGDMGDHKSINLH
jgi:hypothetical protein